MSRAYRIRISESLQRVIRAEDHVSSRLEILQILPADAMAELLAAELEKQGFERNEDALVRREKEVTILIDAKTGEVTVMVESEESLELESSKEGAAYDDYGPTRQQAEDKLRDQARAGLEKDADEKEGELQKQTTDKLEQALADIRRELDQAVNRATAEALKVKAAQLGQIKNVSEDPESGNMTIVVEV